jgi:hypothetical protein
MLDLFTACRNRLELGSKKKDKYSGKHQFQWLDAPWVNFSETTSENRDR